MNSRKNSFSIKIFAGIAIIIFAVGLLVFFVLRIFMPKTYEEETALKITENTAALALTLQNTPMTEWQNELLQFCLLNNTGAAIFDENGTKIGNLNISIYTNTDSLITQTITESDVSLTFENGGKPYTIVFYVNTADVKQVTDTFGKLFPVVIIMDLIISVIIAFLYTHFVVNIKNLQITNEKLQADIKEERRRRDFFSAISHELKTPVTILKGELDGMILNVGKFKDRDKYLKEAYETTESIEFLVRDIMTAAKLHIIKLTPEECNLLEITEDCLNKLKEPINEKNLQIKQNFRDFPICADKKLIQLVMSNIIGNAVKHSPQGALINLSLDENRVFTAANHNVQTENTPYDSDLSGGLGLYIIKSILVLHGFSYSIENTEDVTCFTIIFTKK
ncbi:MAG: HAMP domain-containing histidine kinase [Ruminococcus sp.]|jgi:two-component system sensor histidine kinase VanS|nr:HAMP domain-containing histidine kinase [Ruminococcus sp.]